MSEHGFEEVLAPNQYYDRQFNVDAVKILPGEYYVTRRDMLVVTVLGSCVAACIRDRSNGIGGMNHFMLPDSGQGSDPLSNSARYGSYAMEMLLNQLLKLGAKRQNLEAKVFGGGNVMKHFTVHNVGQRNSTFALDYLKTEKIKVVASDLEGIYPRKVYFFPKTGKVLIKRLRNIHNTTIYERESEYSSRLQQSPIAGDVELF
ncbi:MAG: chemoreceptor glutamine deamidase CheD [Sulfuricellaceae bacterium]|nr:chemoreceptor glutamine deamidase CheD [Sulfuricellaceae bacterium]